MSHSVKQLSGRARQPALKRSMAGEMFDEAMQHYRANRPAEAQRLFRSVLTIVPEHPDSLHLLGLIEYRNGRYEAAADLIGRAIRTGPPNPCYRSNMGNVLMAQGLVDRAEAEYRNALALQPDHAGAYSNLGVVLTRQGRRDEAMEHFRRALALQPDYADAHNNLGIALAAQNRLEDAIAHYERAIALNPKHAHAHENLAGALLASGRIGDAVAHLERALALNPRLAGAHYNLGIAFTALGNPDRAMKHYEQALAIDSDHAGAHNNLGVILNGRAKYDDAVPHFRRALILSPDRAVIHNNLGVALKAQGRVGEAAANYQRAIAIDPAYAAAHNNLGIVFYDLGRLDEAVEQYERALAIKPDYAEAHNNLGVLFKDRGEFAAAMTHYERAIAIRPDYGEAHLNRAEIKTFRHDDADLAVLEALSGAEDLAADNKLYIHFALAKALEDAEDYPRAFEYMSKGNALKRARIDYNEAAAAGFFRRVSAVFNRGLFDRFEGAGDPSSLPVFVLGMPRSGSTLIEQILSRHPQIHGAGELTDLEMAAGGVLNSLGREARYPECVPDLDAAVMRQIARNYLSRLPALAGGKIRLTDKSPGNFLNIGLIRLILPNARIIHTRRNPINTCVSCYSKLFTTGVEFSYNLAELGRYYSRYNQLMTHWRSVLPPGSILDVAYEDVVDDLEGQARRLIEYCGLPWDDRCLDFHKSARPLKTASAVQARQPLFRGSLQRWRKYEFGLEPLLHELADVIPGYAKA